MNPGSAGGTPAPQVHGKRPGNRSASPGRWHVHPGHLTRRSQLDHAELRHERRLRLWISRARGRTFTPHGDLRESLHGEIAINPADPTRMLVGTGGGRCARSEDVWLYGAVQSKSVEGRFQGGIYRSRDGGESWEWAKVTDLSTDTRQADQWAFGPVARFHYLLTTDARPAMM